MAITVVDQAITVLSAVSSELILFFAAITLQYFLFGNVFWLWRSTKASAGKRSKKAGELADVHSSATPSPAAAVEAASAAFRRGDHRGVLRHWQLARKDKEAGAAALLVQVVESMQRLSKDSSAILAEIESFLMKSQAAKDVGYMNQLIEPLSRSLDLELVRSLLELFPKLHIEADALTYEILVHMHFGTRSFGEVLKLQEQMRHQGIKPTTRTSLALLKVALQASKLDAAILSFQQVDPDMVPRHVGLQLVDLACRERRLTDFLPEIEAGRLPLSAEILNTVLGECLRSEDQQLGDRVLSLAVSPAVDKNARTYGLLVRAARGNQERISQLLDEFALSEAGHAGLNIQVATAVLAANNVELAEKLASLLKDDQPNQVPVVLALVRFFVDSGHPEKACGIYDSLLRPKADGNERRRAPLDARTQRSLLAACATCERQDIAAEVMQEDSSRQIAMIRECTAKSDINGAMGVLSTMDVSDPNKLSTSVWNSALDACIEQGDIVKAKDMMQKLCSAGIADTITYNTMLKAFVRQGQFDKALKAKDEMLRAGFLPNSSTFLEIIHGLLRSNMSSQAWEVIKEMKAAGLSPNRVLCAALAKSLKPTSSNEEINRVMQLTESMKEPMDEALLSCIVEACLRVQKPNMLANKLALLRGKDPVAVSAAHTFGSIIKAYGYIKDMAGVWDCWEDMMAKKVTPSSITIGCMVEAVASNGDVDGAYDLLRSLLSHRETKEQVNAVVYGSVIKGFGRLKKMDKVLAVFEDMKSNGIAPSLMTFNAIIDGCARSGQMDKVHHLILDMKSTGLQPNLITKSTMMKGFCAKGDMRTAFAILEEVRGGPEKPDEVVYNTMMDGCVQAGLVVEGEQLVAQMQAEGVAPSNYLLTGLVRLLKQAHQAERALELTQAAASKFRFKLNSHVYNELLQACLACRAYEQGAQAVARAIKDRCPVEGKFCQGIARGLLRGNVEMAVELLRSLLGLTSEGGHQRRQGVHAAALLDDAFIAEVLTALLHQASLERRGESAALLAELKTLKPTLWLEPALLRKVAAQATTRRQ